MQLSKLKITWLQFILMINGVQVGIGIASLPRTLAEKAGSSSWIAILFGGILSTIFSMIIVKIREKEPNKSISTYFQSFVGKIFGKILTFIFSLYFLIFGYVVLERTVLYIKTYILQQTDFLILLILFLIPTLQLLVGGVSVIAKYAEVLFPVVIFIFFMLLFTLKTANINFILPIIKDGWIPIFKTIPVTIMSFLGLESIYFLYPYLDKKEKAMSGVIIANLLTTGIYLFETIICFIVYSPDEILTIFDPPLAILNVLEFQYLERIDIIIIILCISIASTTWIPYMWMGFTGLTESINIKRFIYFILCIFLIFILFSIYKTPTFKLNELYIKVLSNTGAIVVVLMPILLWVGKKLKKIFQTR
ncbi:endospore germination permease [Bacillus sp. OAE603]|uniref:GerAB/ArcD/ProY family transporter n=1 Tax=Gottfriedia sp. OAE603 TaxID=2663872 RepID=UPI0017893E30